MQPKVKQVHVARGHVTGTWLDPHYVFHYVVAGSWLFRLETRLYRVRTGDVLLCPPNVLHFVKPVSGRRPSLYVVHFELPDVPNDEGLDIPEAFTVPARHRQRLAARFLALRREYVGREPAGALITAGIMLEMIGLCIRHCGRPAPFEHVMSKSWRNVEQALRFMEANSTRRLSVREISDRARLSASYFCRVFKEYAGLSPQQYLNRLRIERARALLADPAHNCTEIAGMCGFADVHTFSKVFKRLEGVSPTQWARQMGPFVPRRERF